MLRSMYSGISGMKNMQTKLDVIGNNIANVNTYGFKKGRVTFKDMMSQTVAGASASNATRGGTNPKQVGLGSTLATIDTIHEGSSLQTTNRALDLGIDGDGYFVVRQGTQNLYTRAGNFYIDDNGLLVNGDGMAVQAYKYEGTQLTNELGDVAVNVNAVMSPNTSQKLAFSGNLDSNAKAAGDPITKDDFIYTQQMKVVGENGKAYTVDVHFVKTEEDADKNHTWSVFINKHPLDLQPGSDTDLVEADFTLKYDAENGIFEAPTDDLEITLDDMGTGDDDADDVKLTIPAANIDVSELTQLASPMTAIADADGSTEGKLESFSIGATGDISGVYSNGEIAILGRIALAKFSNSSGLMKAGNNLFQESINSGAANVSAAGEGTGSLVSGSLEMSNVDLSEEFTEMIVAQRGFQANTRIITTSDEILQELVNLKR